MGQICFARIPADRRLEMSRVVTDWRNSRKPVDVLIDALDILAKPGREDAIKKLRRSDRGGIFGLAFTYGEGYSIKGRLIREDATALKELVVVARAKLPMWEDKNRDGLRTVLERATEVLLNGGQLPTTATDDLWGVVLQVVREVSPAAMQETLL